MTWQPDFVPVPMGNDKVFTVVSGGEFSDELGTFKNLVAGTNAILQLNKLFTVYYWQKFTVQNLDVVTRTFSATLIDSLTGTPNKSVQVSVSIPSGGAQDIYLPYLGRSQLLTFVCLGLFVIYDWNLYDSPNAPTLIDTPWGSAEGVAKATTGTVTDNGFNAAKVHSWTVNNGNTGGINYTITPIPVALTTWYALEVITGVPITIVLGTVTYTIKGDLVFTWNSVSFTNPVCQMVNASGANQTVTCAFSQISFDVRSNAWNKTITVGV